MADIASKNIDMGQNLTQKGVKLAKRLSLLSRLKKIKKPSLIIILCVTAVIMITIILLAFLIPKYNREKDELELIQAIIGTGDRFMSNFLQSPKAQMRRNKHEKFTYITPITESSTNEETSQESEFEHENSDNSNSNTVVKTRRYSQSVQSGNRPDEKPEIKTMSVIITESVTKPTEPSLSEEERRRKFEEEFDNEWNRLNERQEARSKAARKWMNERSEDNRKWINDWIG